MAVTVCEICKEYKFEVEGLDYPVFGRVIKTDEIEHLPYRWEVSHYYKPTENAATVYRPSRKNAANQEEAINLLMLYARSFTCIDIKPNKLF